MPIVFFQDYAVIVKLARQKVLQSTPIVGVFTLTSSIEFVPTQSIVGESMASIFNKGQCFVFCGRKWFGQKDVI